MATMTTFEMETLLNSTLAAAEAHNEIMINSLDTFWVMMAGFMVFFMQAGFGILEAGAIRVKNQYNILVKNLCDASLAAATFYLFGYGFAYGEDESGFIGTSEYALSENAGGYHSWIFQFAFAATAATIVSGCVAERTQFLSYMSYTFFITAFIYPTVAHWVWGGGFLSGIGFIDFAGSGVVHMVGGVAGLMGAFWVGPRIGRFEGKIFHVTVNDDDFQPSSPLNCALGVFILWFGWYGFNPGSTVAIYGDANGVAALAAINTTLSACSAAITCFVVGLLLAKMNPSRTKVDVGLLMNSVLAGLVGITGGCSVVTPVSAIIIGIISGVWYMAASHFLKQLKIDDPLDAAPIHLFCGFWGVLAIGIFVDPAAAEAAGFEALPDGEQFGVQFAGGGLIMLWSLLCSTFVFIPLKCLGLLRVDEATELQGLDLVEHKRRRIFGNGIYDHPVLRETFFAFLEEQLVPEHALFVRAVERYKLLFQRELTPDVKDAIRCSAEEIMRTFINDDAQYLVNISHDIMTNVKKQASNSEFTEGLWDPVWKVLRRTVLEMMPAFNISTHARMAETILNWIHNAERYSPELMMSVGHHFSGERNLDAEFNL